MRVCEITGKGTVTGHSVSHSHKLNKRIWKPNLQSTKITVNGTTLKVRVSTKALKTLKSANESEVVKYLKANQKTLSSRITNLLIK